MNNSSQLYISYLRVIATISVIVLHTAAFISMDYKNVSIGSWSVATFINSGVRFCVPLFVMISGALLLGKNEGVKLFLNKRIKKIVVPFLFWSLFYTCWYYKDKLLEVDMELLKIFLNNLYNGSAYHLWYLYMIIGVYAFIPVLRKFTMHATKRQIEYFLLISCIVLIANQYGVKPVVENFVNFGGYVFYLVLGYYLSVIKFNFSSKIVKHGAWIAYVISVLFTFGITFYLSNLANNFAPRYTFYLTFNVAIMSTGVFLLVKHARLKENIIIKQIEKYSFGIYFVHVFILHYLGKLTQYTHIDAYATTLAFVIFISFFVLLISYVIMNLLCRIPLLRKIVM